MTVVKQSPQVTEESEVQYFLRLARENMVGQDQEEDQSAPSSSRNDRVRKIQTKRNPSLLKVQVAEKDLTSSKVKESDSEPLQQREIYEMETALVSFPFRHIGFAPIDARPKMICVFEQDSGQAGRHYSNSCNSQRKPATESGRGSWQMREVPQVLRDEVLKGAHHRALCPMPDMKRELRGRIDMKKEELEALKSKGPSHL
ncbi:unnamed protein product [Heligmosomoides polygyrus]|uniref:BBSome-interacting protein 1 n=1 Tax=Heligmosomoides polygyrus TaxID=6339 RepID=A0A183GEY3_HELPZ|nr:unnamed protein product [Heligmosomoides polygyrus]